MSVPSAGDSRGSREARLEQVLAECLRAIESGRPIDRDALSAEHPDLVDDLRSFFVNREAVERLAGPLRQAASPADTPTVGMPPVAGGGEASRIRYFGDYELLEEIARGGMGVVYKARQTSLNRLVALKMILAGQFASEADVRRFQQEAEAAAGLDHPHIVPIHEVGQHAGLHYFSMKLIEGTSLRPVLPDVRADLRSAIRLMSTVARAVHHAHQRGVLHRDLKPGNILIDRDGTPHVTDFGLAKRVEAPEEFTQTGAILGTPNYMAPEQASARRQLTTAVDVYSLGAILYEILAGQPPFQGDSVMDTVLKVRTEEPKPLRAQDPAVDPDLETICLKCLEKEPEKRYGSAEALADELDRWQRGEPIIARPVGRAERFRRWCRRNPTIAGLSALAAVSLICGTTAATFFAVRASQRATDAENEKNKAVESERRMRQAQEDENLARGESWHTSYINRITLARRGWDAGNMAFCREHLEATPPPLRGWEYRYLSERVYGLETTLPAWSAVAMTPDGGRIVSPGAVWNALTGQRLFEFEAGYETLLSPDGTRIAAGGDNGLSIFDSATGQRVLSFEGKVKQVRALAWSPDSSRLATVLAEGVNQLPLTVKVWDALSGQEVAVLKGVRDCAKPLIFSPDGRTIALSHLEGVTGVWDAATGELIRTFAKHGRDITVLVFAGDGRDIVSGALDETVRVSDVATGAERYVLRGLQLGVNTLAVSADGKRLAAGSEDGLVRLYDLNEGNQIAVLKGHGARWQTAILGGDLRSVVFSPDSRLLAVGCDDGVIRLYDAARGEETSVLKGHGAGVRSIVFSSDGKRIVSGSHDGTMKIWAVDSSESGLSIPAHNTRIRSVRFSPDSERLVTAAKEQAVRVWEIRTGRKVLSLDEHLPEAASAEFTADGRHIVTWSSDNKVRIWTADTGTLVVTHSVQGWVGNHTIAGDRPGKTVAVSPDGSRLIAGAGDTVTVYDLLTGKTLATRKGLALELGLAVWSRDGTRIAAVDVDSRKDGSDVTIFRWDRADDTRLAYFRSYDWVTDATFSPDGKQMAVATDAAKVAVRDTTTAAELFQLLGHMGAVLCLDYNSNGTRIVTGGSDRTVRIWDATSGQELLSLSGHAAEVTSVAFSPDGDRIASGDMSGHVRVWEAGRPELDVYAFRGHAGDISAGAFLPDGQSLVTGSWDTTLKVWDVRTGRERHTMQGHKDRVTAVAVSRAAPRIASCDLGGTVKLWDATSGTELRTFAGPGGWNMPIAISSDGTRVAAGYQDDAIRIRNAEGSALSTLPPHKGGNVALAFGPEGTWLASGGSDGLMRMSELDSGEERWSVSAHAGGVERIAVSPDGSRIASTGRDSRTRIWNAETGEGLSIVENSWCENLLWTPDGQRLLTVSGGTVRMWDVGTGGENVAIVVPWTGRGEPFFALDGSRLARVGLNTIRVCTLPADVAERRRTRLRHLARGSEP